MAISLRTHTRRLLGDYQGVWSHSPTDVDAMVDRGTRDLGRRALLLQKRRTFQTVPGTTIYTLPDDHVQTFTIFRGLFSASVRLLSQDGHVWWLLVLPNGTARFVDAQPAGAILLATPDTYWLVILSSDSTTFYIYPSNLGDVLVGDTQPATGTGTTSTIELRDEDGFAWYPAVSDMRSFSLSSTGAATLSASAVDDHAMQRVEPEAITRIDPRATTAAPERYSVMGGLLLVHPSPNAIYQLRQLYFSDDVATRLAVVESEPPLFAAALVLQQRQAGQAGQQLLAMYRAEIQLIGENLSPFSRDGLDLYTMPARI